MEEDGLAGAIDGQARKRGKTAGFPAKFPKTETQWHPRLL
jgi:hypothetical protein